MSEETTATGTMHTKFGKFKHVVYEICEEIYRYTDMLTTIPHTPTLTKISTNFSGRKQKLPGH